MLFKRFDNLTIKEFILQKGYIKEKHLVRDFNNLNKLSTNEFSLLKSKNEFNYLGGRTDIIGITNDNILISFEAKLVKWKKALEQAYRNTSFSHYSYVVMPNEYQDKIVKHKNDFLRRGVGLCTIVDDNIKITIPACLKKPIQPWLTKSAIKYIEDD